jgi:hypothetical protein
MFLVNTAIIFLWNKFVIFFALWYYCLTEFVYLCVKIGISITHYCCNKKIIEQPREKNKYNKNSYLWYTMVWLSEWLFCWVAACQFLIATNWCSLFDRPNIASLLLYSLLWYCEETQPTKRIVFYNVYDYAH